MLPCPARLLSPCQPTRDTHHDTTCCLAVQWTSWARRFLMYELMLYGAWLAAFTAFTLLFQHEDVSLSFWGLLANRWAMQRLVALVALVSFVMACGESCMQIGVGRQPNVFANRFCCKDVSVLTTICRVQGGHQ